MVWALQFYPLYDYQWLRKQFKAEKVDCVSRIY